MLKTVTTSKWDLQHWILGMDAPVILY